MFDETDMTRRWNDRWGPAPLATLCDTDADTRKAPITLAGGRVVRLAEVRARRKAQAMLGCAA